MPGLKLHRGFFQMLAIVLLTILISFTPISSKAINLAWILLFLVACSLILTAPLGREMEKPSKGVSCALRALIAFFLSGLAMQLMMRLYWGEPVRGLSFEITALASAVFAQIVARRWQPSSHYQTFFIYGLVVASSLALIQGYGYMFRGLGTPTNAVNWAAGLALLLCLSLAAAVDAETMFREKILSVLGVCLFSLSIFVAGRKGAFFAILWAAAVGIYFYWGGVRRKPSKAWRMLVPVVLVGVISTLHLATNWFAAPINRVVIAAAQVTEAFHREQGSETVLKGTVGGRIHMHEIGIEATFESPWVGLGASERDQIVKRAELDLHEPLFHLHSEYLQAWVAYGVPGLLGALSFPMGLLVAGLLIRRDAPAAAVALFGLGLIHFLSGLSNVNTFHNYYGTVFAVCVVVPFLMLHPTARGDPRKYD